uniref:Uncharacterized protein n=1 Tax=Anguilla anguilla TaxID=7936 RepID=A0A0E9WT62_ANGAN
MLSNLATQKQCSSFNKFSRAELICSTYSPIEHPKQGSVDHSHSTLKVCCTTRLTGLIQEINHGWNTNNNCIENQHICHPL